MYTLSRDVLVTGVKDESVILDGRRGRYFQLNATGTAALTLLLDGVRPEQAAARIAEGSGASGERVFQDVLALIDALRRARLVIAR